MSWYTIVLESLFVDSGIHASSLHDVRLMGVLSFPTSRAQRASSSAFEVFNLNVLDRDEDARGVYDMFLPVGGTLPGNITEIATPLKAKLQSQP